MRGLARYLEYGFYREDAFKRSRRRRDAVVAARLDLAPMDGTASQIHRNGQNRDWLYRRGRNSVVVCYRLRACLISHGLPGYHDDLEKS